MDVPSCVTAKYRCSNLVKKWSQGRKRVARLHFGPVKKWSYGAYTSRASAFGRSGPRVAAGRWPHGTGVTGTGGVEGDPETRAIEGAASTRQPMIFVIDAVYSGLDAHPHGSAGRKNNEQPGTTGTNSGGRS